MPKRSKIEIIEDILDVLRSQPDGMTANRLATYANLPYDRLARFLSELQERGLVHIEVISNRHVVKVTEKGLKLLYEIKKFKKLLKDFGLS